MWIKEEIGNGYELEEHLWGSQAKDTWKEITDAGKEDQALNYFEEIFCDEEAINITTINDILAYDSEDLMEYLGMGNRNKEWYILDEEFKTLKQNNVLSEAHIGVIQENLDCGFQTTTWEELNDVEDMTDEEVEELDRVVA